MGKVSEIQLRAQAVILAKEEYSQSLIAEKLGHSKCWVTKWVGRSRSNDSLVDKERCVQPKVLTNCRERKYCTPLAQIKDTSNLRLMSPNSVLIINALSTYRKTKLSTFTMHAMAALLQNTDVFMKDQF